jgi:lysophospholipase L1-like esterase
VNDAVPATTLGDVIELTPDPPRRRRGGSLGWFVGGALWAAVLSAVVLFLVRDRVFVGGSDDVTGGAEAMQVVSLPRLPDDPSITLPAPEIAEIRTVAIVGDSITQGSDAELRFTLTASGITGLAIDGETSRRIEVGDGTGTPLSGIATLYGMLADGLSPDAWVVALGTNDVGLYGDEAEYRALVRDVVDMLPAEAPLVWVDTYREQFLDDTETFNRVVREELETRGNAVVASWYAVATSPDDVLQSDRVHPNDRGRAAFAALVAAGLDALGG